GRPVRFAPRKPGASPTISNSASTPPKGGTGPLNHSGCALRCAPRKPARREQTSQSCGGDSTATARLRLLYWLGPHPVDLFAGVVVAHDARREILELDEIICLPAQIVGDHRRRRADRRNDRYAYAFALHRLDEPPEVPVARKQDRVVDMRGHLEHV